jgi:hypothetical protein
MTNPTEFDLDMVQMELELLTDVRKRAERIMYLNEESDKLEAALIAEALEFQPSERN